MVSKVSRYRLCFRIKTITNPKEMFRRIWDIIEVFYSDVYGFYNKIFLKNDYKFFFIVENIEDLNPIFWKVEKELNMKYPKLFNYYQIVSSPLEWTKTLLMVKALTNDSEDIKSAIDSLLKEHLPELKSELRKKKLLKI
jgi:hypothetical protein